MASILPNTNQVQQLTVNFLDDAQKAFSNSIYILKDSIGFRTIYRNSLATDAILSKLLRGESAPPQFAARRIVVGVPLLICVQQFGAAKIELRRFLELITWGIYFHDHHIEWERFKSRPTRGYYKEEKDPIEHSAHRDLEYYLNYAKSRVKADPSQLASQMVDKLRGIKGTLNEAVHPGAITELNTRSIPLDPINSTSLNEFANLQRSLFKYACLLLASIHRNRFDRFPAIYRAHFDWLIGKDLAKRVRSGPFGLVT